MFSRCKILGANHLSRPSLLATRGRKWPLRTTHPCRQTALRSGRNVHFCREIRPSANCNWRAEGVVVSQSNRPFALGQFAEAIPVLPQIFS